MARVMVDKVMENTSRFDGLLSLDEASEYWDIHSSTIRKAILRDKFKMIEDIYKFGKTWVVTVEAMTRVFGEPAVEFNYKKELVIEPEDNTEVK